jgi:hypothetical protein
MTGAHELPQSERAEGLHKKNAGLPEEEHIDESSSVGAGTLSVRCFPYLYLESYIVVLRIPRGKTDGSV